MHDGDPELGTDQSARSRGVDVADDDDPVGTMFHADLFVSDHDVAGLFGMCAAADPKMKVGRRDTQIRQYRIRHIAVVMLAGVHEYRLGPFACLQCVVQRRNFHEIRPRGGNEVYGGHKSFPAVSSVRHLNG